MAKNEIEQAKATVEKLEALQASQVADLARLQGEVEALQSGLGDRLLSTALSDGDVGIVQTKASRELDALRARTEGSQAMAAALEIRLADARRELSIAKALELQVRADALLAEVEVRKTKLAALCKQITDLEGPGSMLINPEYSKTEALQQQAERMKGAADMMLGGHEPPVDRTTGRAFDAEL